MAADVVPALNEAIMTSYRSRMNRDARIRRVSKRIKDGTATLQDGHTYNFITAGDVDSLSFLKVVLNQHDLDFMLCSTGCMAAEDILQIQQWWEAGRIKKFDMYMGEIFPGSYKIEWQMVKKFYATHPDVGRAAIFKNHSKIYAGCNVADGFYFGIQTSANINTNPRTEQGSITVDKGIFDFYKDYFDGINSFEK